MTHAPRPVLLCILDGWGHREASADNAIALAETPVWDELMRAAPNALLETSGAAVGLPEGQMGNSEVGHMNLGGGRVVMQDLPRIDAAFAAGELENIQAFQELIAALKASGGICHLMGLVSPGGVHSHQDHIAHIANALDGHGIPVRVHAFLDGRDTPPKSAVGFIRDFEADIAGCNNAEIATIAGRYYAMDRDKRWDRTKLAYDMLVDGAGRSAASAGAAITDAYDAGESDEFVKPTVVAGYDGMKAGDAILMANFRADRARQILTALLDPEFDGFARDGMTAFSAAAGMVAYSSAHAAFMTTLFPPITVNDSLGEIVSAAGLKQLRIAETEKYAHVTFFFNGGEERVFEGEERILVPSPKVATYDLQPEMSAPEVTDKLVAAIESGAFDLIVANYANPDMVGHTGIMPAAVKAVETVDACLGRLKTAIEAVGGAMLITSDHGNVELMRNDETDQPHTAHTVLDVPIVLVGDKSAELANGRLADVAPTVLTLMGLPQPEAMTGASLLAGTEISEQREAQRARA